MIFDSCHCCGLAISVRSFADFSLFSPVRLFRKLSRRFFTKLSRGCSIFANQHKVDLSYHTIPVLTAHLFFCYPIKTHLRESSRQGVGISGQEARQAVIASDFAMEQFRFLVPF